jgi:hypothetical protein
MRIGAKIMLSSELDAMRDGLASLADSSWVMNLPQRQGAYYRHPAGRARRGLPGSDAGTWLIAVTFGVTPEAFGSSGTLPVHWESVELGDALAMLMAGNITLGPAASPWCSSLALGGFCRLLPVADGGDEQARVDLLKKVARSFITDVAVAVASSAGPSNHPHTPGPASSWVNG